MLVNDARGKSWRNSGRGGGQSGRGSGRPRGGTNKGPGSGRPRRGAVSGKPAKSRTSIRNRAEKVAKVHRRLSDRVTEGMNTIQRTTDRVQQSRAGQALANFGKGAKKGIIGPGKGTSFFGNKEKEKENSTESGPPTSTVRGPGALRRLGSAAASAAGNVRSAAGNVSSAATEAARQMNQTRKVYTQVGKAVARGMIGKKSNLTSPRPPPASLRPGHRTWAYAE